MNKTIKVSELKKRLASLPEDADISFGPISSKTIGSLTIHRIKQHAAHSYNIEFNETFKILSDPMSEEPN